jgi:RecB family exonuclease
MLDFEGCRRRFELSHVLGQRGLREQSPELFLGQALHAALRDVYRLPAEERELGTAERAFRKLWSQLPGRRAIFLTEEAEAAVGNAGLNCLRTYFQHYRHELEIERAAVECTLSAPLANGAVIRGRVDRIDHGHGGSPADSLIVTDYKSGACRFDTPSDLVHDRAAQVYALIVSRAAGRAVTEIRFHYLRENRQLCWAVEQDDLELIEEEIMRATRAILLEREFPLEPGHHCTWCRHRRDCPEGEGQLSREHVLAGEPPEVPF